MCRKKNRTREQVKEDNRKAMKSARRSYESAQKSRDSAVRKAEREVEDKQKNWIVWRSKGVPMKSWNRLSWNLRERAGGGFGGHPGGRGPEGGGGQGKNVCGRGRL